jgi:hypothetical protein
MRYVGGYESYLALQEDECALEDVELVMMGEADAAKIEAQQREMEQRGS